MKRADNIRLIDLGIMIDDDLILCDMHIGIEDELVSKGILIPKYHMRDLLERTKGIISKSGRSRFRRIILNGDMKHEFGRISDEEWRHAIQFIDFVSRYCDEIILVKGNHDTILGPIADKKGIKVAGDIRIGNALILHGDILPDTKDLENIDTVIIGHEHPAITIKEGTKSERFKCYLLGNYLDKKLLVQPSLHLLSIGTDIRTGKLLSPFLKRRNLDDFRVIIVGDTLYDFGKLGKI